MEQEIIQGLLDIQQKYRYYIYQLMDDNNIPLFLREHYSESPNWYLNNDIQNMIDSVRWHSSEQTYENKIQILNDEIDHYLKK